jgi:3-mercaptopyruvate sulfurtransferase SseA
MKYFQLFRITGVANVITFDGGLKSTESEKKRLVACHIQTDKHAGTDDNDVQGYHERAKVFDIPEKLFPACLKASTAPDKAEPTSKPVPVDLDIPAGEAFKVAMKCAATAVDIRGAYEYEIIS